MVATPISCCRICGNSEIERVLSLGDQQLTGVFPASPDVPVLNGPLELVRCRPDGDHTCGLLQLRHSFPSAAMYGDNYGYRSGLNQSMVRHLEGTVKSLLEIARPAPGDMVLDIGCNDGTLLKAYPLSLLRVGIDPVAKKFREFYPSDIEVITDFFSRDQWVTHFGSRRARIITSIAMFYDLESPREFVSAVADCLEDDGIWHFEQSYMPLMLEQLAYDTICHEHIEYYALRQIDWMLRRADMKIIRLEPSLVNGGSLAVTAAKSTSRHAPATEAVNRLLDAERRAGFETMEPFAKFRDRVFRHRNELKATVDNLVARGEKLLGYGASTKGNVLLQFCGFGPDQIPAIGEVNPGKFGCFTPGSLIPIVSEAAMHALSPDVLLVLPWHFRENLIERESDFLSRGGRLLFPLPRIEFHPR